jgi:Ca-activated chloride channel homolog
MRLPSRPQALAGCVAAALAAAGLIAQTAPRQDDFSQKGDPAIIRADVRVVVLHTTVVDKSGHFVTDLPQQAFTVLENGAKQTMQKFKREDVPVSMGLIVDNSGSMRDKRAKVEAAAVALAKASNAEDEVFVVNFNDEAFLDLPAGTEFTSDIKMIQEALTRIDSKGGTLLRDSVRMSIDYLKEKGHRDKKVLVVVTDGDDNASETTLESLVKIAQQSEVLIYTVGLLGENDRSVARRAERELKALSQATGGESYFPKEVSEVDQVAHQVARDIRSQYIIQYRPSNEAMDGTYRQVKVVVNAAGKPTVRTRSGYYATPDRQTAPPAQPPPGAASLKR